MRHLTLLGLLLALPALAQPSYTEPLGIGLETWPYPHPVRFLDLTLEGQRVRMAYMDVAPAAAVNGRAVVLLHGKNFFGAYWENTIRALTAAGYRVVVPDQIGFGKSSKPDLRYTFDLLAANTARLLDTLGLPKVDVVGHSTGGMIAVRFARTYPERVDHLVLEDPVGLEDYRLKVPPVSDEQAYETELAQTPEKLRGYFTSYLADQQSKVLEPYVEAFSRVLLSGEYPRWAKASALTAQMIYQQPVRHEFSLLQTPTLLVVGQEDRTAIGKDRVPEAIRRTLGDYPALGRAAVRDLPHGQLCELTDCGHLPHLEAPERFHAALLAFLAR